MFGRLSDQIGRKFLMLLACVLALAALAALQYPMVAFVFTAYFLSGVANSIFWPLVEAWIGHGSNREGLIKFMGLFGAVFTTGIALGSLLAGFFTKMSPLSILGLGAFISLGVGGSIALTKETRPCPVDTAGADGIPSREVHPEPKASRRPFMLIGWIANFGTWITIGIIRFLFPKLCVGLGISPIPSARSTRYSMPHGR